MEAKEVKNFFDQLSAEEKAKFFHMVCQELSCLPMSEQMSQMMSMMSACCSPKHQAK